MNTYTFDKDDIMDDKNNIYLYMNKVTQFVRDKNELMFVGMISDNEDEYNIHFDFQNDVLSNVIGFECVDIFQCEEELNKTDFKNVENILNEIYDVLKINGLFRLSLPDYKSDLLKNRVVYYKNTNSIKYDAYSGSTYDEKTDTVTGGAKWYPTIEIVKLLIENSKFKDSKIEYLQYYDENDQKVLNNIDYTKGYISRTPDNDNRVDNTPLSIVVDIYKVSCRVFSF